jgi:hypothetical protein
MLFPKESIFVVYILKGKIKFNEIIVCVDKVTPYTIQASFNMIWK